jgi:SOS-response transcriptional repressor LexA
MHDLVSEQEHLLLPPLARLRRRSSKLDCVAAIVEYHEELVEVEATAAAPDGQHSQAVYRHVGLSVAALAEHLEELLDHGVSRRPAQPGGVPSSRTVSVAALNTSKSWFNLMRRQRRMAAPDYQRIPVAYRQAGVYPLQPWQNTSKRWSKSRRWLRRQTSSAMRR